MSALSDSQIAAAAKGAGLTGNNVAIAVAIAIAESGGDPRSHNPVYPDDSYGLWQINALAHSKSKLGITSYDQLYDPATNARAMMLISGNGQNWRPWTTYTRGTYLRFLARGRSAASGTGGDTSTGATPVTPVSVAGDLSKFGDLVSDPAVYRKAGMVVLGGLCILIGLVVLFHLENLAPIGKVGKVAKLVTTAKG